MSTGKCRHLYFPLSSGKPFQPRLVAEINGTVNEASSEIWIINCPYRDATSLKMPRRKVGQHHVIANVSRAEVKIHACRVQGPGEILALCISVCRCLNDGLWDYYKY